MDKQVERYRQMTGEVRLAVALELHEMSCDIARDGIRRQHPVAYCNGPAPAALPATPQPPALRPGNQTVSLWWFRRAACVECLPAPVGSHLVVFRFSQLGHSLWRPSEAALFAEGDPASSLGATEAFVALDTQLAEWIPGRLLPVQF